MPLCKFLKLLTINIDVCSATFPISLRDPMRPMLGTASRIDADLIVRLRCRLCLNCRPFCLLTPTGRTPCTQRRRHYSSRDFRQSSRPQLSPRHAGLHRCQSLSRRGVSDHKRSNGRDVYACTGHIQYVTFYLLPMEI